MRKEFRENGVPASPNMKSSTMRPGWRGGPAIIDGVPVDGKRVDICISYLPTESSFAHEIAKGLRALGYTVALYDEKGDLGAQFGHLGPNDARYVIVIWTPPVADAPQLKADARSAAMRGALIEVAFRKGCPKERFTTDALISFKRIENLTPTEQWRQLLARVKPLCGEPHRPIDSVVRHAPTVGLGMLAMGAGGVAMMFVGAAKTAPTPQPYDFVAPEALVAEAQYTAPTKRISATPTVDFEKELARGGPEKDFISLDQGTAPKGEPPQAAPPPPPVVRGVQGPEE